MSWEFEEFRLSERELLRHGEPVRIAARPLKVLVYLVRARPRIVSRDELVRSVWTDEGATHDAEPDINDETVDKTVRRAAAALGDDAGHPRFVEVVKRQGYRFIAPVVERGTGLVEARSAYIPGDRSRFVRDVNIPDGSTVRIGERFTKRWEILNAGTVAWTGRYLERQGPVDAPGRLQSAERVRIPDTSPGQSCIVEVDLVAPRTPGSCYAEWKMVDERGRFCLPKQTAIYISVDVKE